MAVRAVVGIAMIRFLAGCGPVHHALEIPVAPQRVSVTPIDLGSGAKVSLVVLDERPTKTVQDWYMTRWVHNDTRFTVSALGDVTAALAQSLRDGLMTLGFEFVPTPQATAVTLEVHLLSLAMSPPGPVGVDVMAQASAEVRRGQTPVFQRRYNASSRYSFPLFTRRWNQEKINTELSNLIGNILADLELLAALKKQ